MADSDDDVEERVQLLDAYDGKPRVEVLVRERLTADDDSEARPSLAQSRAAKPFPWRPVLVVLCLNAVQPLAYELIFPFISP